MPDWSIFTDTPAGRSFINARKRGNARTYPIKYVDKKSPVMRPNIQPKIYKSPVVA